MPDEAGQAMLTVLPERDDPYRLLVLGAHPDDIEIGCAATLMRLVADHPSARLRWVVFSGEDARADEARRSADALVGDPARVALTLHGYRDGFFPYDGASIKEAFVAIKGSFEPDLILTHRLEDAHQDHRLIAELTWQTFRSAMILEYEIPKYEGDLGRPNLFVTVSPDLADRKVQHLLTAFPSQRDRRWFSEDLFRATLRLRGIECASPSGLAEGFTCRKVTI